MSNVKRINQNFLICILSIKSCTALSRVTIHIIVFFRIVYASSSQIFHLYQEMEEIFDVIDRQLFDKSSTRVVKQDIIFHFNEVENLFHIFAPISFFEARFFFNLSEIIKARLHDLCTKLGPGFESFENQRGSVYSTRSRLFKLNGSANKGR